MKLIALIVLVIWCPFGFTHQDTLLKYQYGEILGLPSDYQPALFDRNVIALKIGKNELIFPACLKKYFTTNNSHRLTFMASWYHDLDISPPYMLIDIEFGARDFSYRLFFDMVEIIPVSVAVITSHANGLYEHHIDIGDYCRGEIKKNLRVDDA